MAASLVQIAELLIAQLHGGSRDILLKMRHLRRARDGQDDGASFQNPCKCNLTGRGTLMRSQSGQDGTAFKQAARRKWIPGMKPMPLASQ